jgi:nitrite reductase/ring-hydroxylating ferredoxin subunit
MPDLDHPRPTPRLVQVLTTEHHEGVSTEPGRRGHALLVIAVTVVAVSATTILLVELVVGSGSPGPPWVRAGSVSEVQRRQVVYVPVARAYVVDASSGNPIALYARSPHLGERIRYCASSGWFEEQAHGSMFDGLGRYVLGPAPRGLDRFDVRIIDDNVWVDTSNLVLGPPRGPADTHPSGPLCRSQ